MMAVQMSHHRITIVFTLLTAVYLLMDFVTPDIPGAFRFNADESVIDDSSLEKARVAKTVEFKPSSPNLVHPLLGSISQEVKAPVDPERSATAPDILLLPRRNPSSDRSSQRSSEDH